MRRLIAFPCEGETLVGTLDEAAGVTGLLIVSGGNEVRSGAHLGMALLAARMAESGVPVFRYDRRGVGDSSGENGGYASAAPDLLAAAAAFRAQVPHLDRLIGFGNCDAATTLALHGRSAGIAAIVLANPWTGDGDDPLPSAAAIRKRYADRLRDPREWRRLLTGDVNIGKLLRGLDKIAGTPSEPDPLAGRIVEAIRSWEADAVIVLAEGDATAITFTEAARRLDLHTPTTVLPTASHSFARSGDAAALEAAIRAAL